MSQSLLEIVEGFEMLANISNAMRLFDSRAVAIATALANLRSPETLRQITDQITNTGQF